MAKTPTKSSGKNWIAGAIKNPGAFTAKSEAAGKSVQALMVLALLPGLVTCLAKGQANPAKTLTKIAKKGK